MSWKYLEAQQPELAAFGMERLNGRVAYLATVRKDGSPRLHPMTPIIGQGYLFVFEVILYMSVGDLSGTFQELQERGLSPSPEVLNKPKGRRETSIIDPDGYRLVFFQKK